MICDTVQIVVLLLPLHTLHLYMILRLLIEPAGDNPALRQSVRDLSAFSLGGRSRSLLGKHGGADIEPREMILRKVLPRRYFV